MSTGPPSGYRNSRQMSPWMVTPEDDRQEEQGTEERVPRSRWLSSTATSSPSTNWTARDHDAEHEGPHHRVDVLARRGALEQELLVVVEADEVEGRRREPVGVRERVDDRGQRRPQREQQVQEQARAAAAHTGSPRERPEPNR